MLFKNKFFLIGFLLLCFQAHSQNDILDFIVKDNDTLYGTLRFNGTKKMWFYQRVNLENGKSEIKEQKLSKKIKTIRKDGKIYHLRDGRYQTKMPVYPDYIVTPENDTIFGTIKSPKFFGKRHLLDRNGEKFFIKPELVKAFRIDNSTYRYLEENPEGNVAQKGEYFKIILDGEVSLYDFSRSRSGWADFSGIYVKKGEEFQRVYNAGFLLVTKELFGDHEELMKRIEEREFTVDNIYLVTQIYNRFLQNQ